MSFSLYNLSGPKTEIKNGIIKSKSKSNKSPLPKLSTLSGSRLKSAVGIYINNLRSASEEEHIVLMDTLYKVNSDLEDEQYHYDSMNGEIGNGPSKTKKILKKYKIHNLIEENIDHIHIGMSAVRKSFKKKYNKDIDSFLPDWKREE